MTRRWRFLTTECVVCVLAMFLGCGGGTNEEADPTPPPGGAERGQAEPEARSYTAVELLDAAEAGSPPAKGESLTVRAVTGKPTDDKGKLWLPAGGDGMIGCTLTDPTQGRKLKTGSEVTVAGRFSNAIEGVVFLEGCSVVLQSEPVGPIEVTATELASAADRDQAACSAKYRGQQVRVTGRIHHLEYIGDLALALDHDGQFWVEVQIPPELMDQDYRYGQEVVVEGRCHSVADNLISIRDTTVVELSPYEPPDPQRFVTVPPNELLKLISAEDVGAPLTHPDGVWVPILVEGEVKEIDPPRGVIKNFNVRLSLSDELTASCAVHSKTAAEILKVGDRARIVGVYLSSRKPARGFPGVLDLRSAAPY